MEEIDRLLKISSMQDIQIPLKIQHRIEYTLKNKIIRKRGFYIKRFLIALASTIIVLLSGVSAYAAFGGTILGKPVIEWLGIRFPDEYQYYRVAVDSQEIKNGETQIDLVSTVCDDGFSILEFNVKLSKEDKEYLRLGENVVTEEDIIEAEKENEYTAQWFRKNKDLKNTIYLSFNTKILLEDGTQGVNDSNQGVVINGKTYWVTNFQTATKISDYEYKVYQLYFLTDKEIGDKTEFTITLNDVKLRNQAEFKKTENGIMLGNIPRNARKMDIDGNFEVTVSKEKTAEDTKIIETNNQEIVNYKNMKKTIEKLEITPLQTIIKVKTIMKNVSLNSLSNTRNKDFVGFIDFYAYNEKGENLSILTTETQRKITYADGRVEEWARGDIGTWKTFYNATMELTEYLVIEKNEDSILTLKPVVRQPTTEKEEKIELDKVNINLKDAL